MEAGFSVGADLSLGPCVLSEGDLRDLTEKVGVVAAQHGLCTDLVVDRGVSVAFKPDSTRPLHFLWAHAEIRVLDQRSNRDET
jgi:hypothetical protein